MPDSFLSHQYKHRRKSPVLTYFIPRAKCQYTPSDIPKREQPNTSAIEHLLAQLAS